MKWFWNRCRRRPEISLLAAGALGAEEKIELETHLAACQQCKDYYSEIKALTAPWAAWEKSFHAVEATPATRRRWARDLREVGAPSLQRRPLLKYVWDIVWGELIRPNRYAWTGMAALWVAILAVNGQLSDHAMKDAGARASSSRDMMEAWAEQNRVLAELEQPVFVVPVPPPAVPRPRSERKQDWQIV